MFTDRKWLTLAAVTFASFATTLDNTVVNVALPSIQHDLHLGRSGLEWVVNSYVLAFGMLLLAQQQHVVTGGSVVLGHAGGSDVGPRTLEEPPVPQQDARHRGSTSTFDGSGFDTLAVQPRCGSLSWEGS